ncbi:MAG: type IV secretion system DNA-binding domain-containing protein [Verrucomicrobia bacterium]|nr:type IV secretion system DNA-binding domain-containing protein [Verrucomicrobiota bacterium]
MEQALTVPELLTEQFYAWELRGRGWMVWPAPVALEPPFRPFLGHAILRHQVVDDGQFETGLSRFVSSLVGRVRGGIPTVIEAPEEPEEPSPEFIAGERDLVELQVALPPDFEASREVFEQFLFSLTFCKAALAFEVVGTKEGIVAQLVAETSDAQLLYPQLKAHFPEAVINPVQNYLSGKWNARDRGVTEIREFGLEREFMLPLLSASELATDPLVGICAALEYLREDEVAVFQALFEPVRHHWAESTWRAVTLDGSEPFFENDAGLTLQTKRKLASPLLAVVVRTAARAASEERVWELVKGLAGALALFRNPSGNELAALENEDYPDNVHETDLLERCSRRSGMLLNSDELVSLAHLPTAAVRSRKLKREVKRSKEPPAIATGPGVILGENAHEGTFTKITVRPQQRVRHMHVIGASGTGKSTLLLNLICQDIYQRQGVGVLDPHGDLIDQILGYVPPERYADVILFDPSDEMYPIGFNILSAHSNLEKNLLASDLVAVFRRLSTSWGDQMTSVLGNAILAFLESKNGGTLADLRRFLIEPAYRKEFLPSVEDPEVVYYWEHEFPLLKSNTLGPLLTRLDTFLRPKTIRYVVGQRENKLDFSAMMNEGKIFLAKLPQGIIGEENAYLLGALLVSKFHQLTISRQQMEAEARRPFYLYLDEFQHFVTPSMATILSGVRKYQLGLILAHHELRQLQRNEDVASAVLSHPYTRICFRVGDEDARKLAEGFAFFETSDLQNLGTGEAICRMERAEYDFNLKTILPPEVDTEGAAKRRAYLQYLSRLSYGTPREKVEQELAQSRAEPKPPPVDPFAKRAASLRKEAEKDADAEKPAEEKTRAEDKKSDRPNEQPLEPPSEIPAAPVLTPKKTPVAEKKTERKPPPEPALLGRGGPQHKYLQHLIKQLAIGMGFEADVERTLLDGEGSVDVELRRGEKRFAFEISITTPVEHELGNIRKCVKSGYDDIVIVCPEVARADKMREAAAKAGIDAGRCRVCTQEDLSALLIEFAAKAQSKDVVSHGKKTRVTYKALTPEEAEKRRALLAKISTRSLKKLKGRKGE